MIRALRSLSPRGQLVVLGLAFEGGLLVLGLLCAWLFSVPVWPRLAVTWEAVFLGVAAVAPLLILLALTVTFPVGPLREIDSLMDEAFIPMLRHATLADLLLLCVLAGLGEEIFFRGVLQDRLGAWCGPAIGLALASLAFGLAHLITPTYAVLVTGVGVYFGLLFLWTESLLVVSLAHGLYDFIALLYLVRVRVPTVEEPEDQPAVESDSPASPDD